MKKNKKNNNKVDKILKGVVTAGVAIGGASYMNDADMVYAAELGGEDKYEDNPGIQELAEASTTASESLVEEESEIAETSESAAESLAEENSELAEIFKSDSTSVSEEISQVESTSEVKSESVASETSELNAASESIAEKVASEEAEITAASQSAAASLAELRTSEENASASASTSGSQEESTITSESEKAASESNSIAASLEAESVSLSNSIASMDASLSTSMSTATSEADSASTYASEAGEEYISASESFERDYTGEAGKTLDAIDKILQNRDTSDWTQNWNLAKLVLDYGLKQNGYTDISWNSEQTEPDPNKAENWTQNSYRVTFKDAEGNSYAAWVDDVPVFSSDESDYATGGYQTWPNNYKIDHLIILTKTMQFTDSNGTKLNYSLVRDQETGDVKIEIKNATTGEEIDPETTQYVVTSTTTGNLIIDNGGATPGNDTYVDKNGTDYTNRIKETKVEGVALVDNSKVAIISDAAATVYNRNNGSSITAYTGTQGDGFTGHNGSNLHIQVGGTTYHNVSTVEMSKDGKSITISYQELDYSFWDAILGRNGRCIDRKETINVSKSETYTRSFSNTSTYKSGDFVAYSSTKGNEGVADPHKAKGNNFISENEIKKIINEENSRKNERDSLASVSASTSKLFSEIKSEVKSLSDSMSRVRSEVISQINSRSTSISNSMEKSESTSTHASESDSIARSESIKSSEEGSTAASEKESTSIQKSESLSTSNSIARSESLQKSESLSDSASVARSESLQKSESLSESTSLSQSESLAKRFSESVSESVSRSESLVKSESVSDSASISRSESLSVSESEFLSRSESLIKSASASESTSIADSQAYSTSIADSQAYSTSIADSQQYSTSIADSQQYSTSIADSQAYSTSISASLSTSESTSTSLSQSTSASLANNGSQNIDPDGGDNGAGNAPAGPGGSGLVAEPATDTAPIAGMGRTAGAGLINLSTTENVNETAESDGVSDEIQSFEIDNEKVPLVVMKDDDVRAGQMHHHR